MWVWEIFPCLASYCFFIVTKILELKRIRHLLLNCKIFHCISYPSDSKLSNKGYRFHSKIVFSLGCGVFFNIMFVASIQEFSLSAQVQYLRNLALITHFMIEWSSIGRSPPKPDWFIWFRFHSKRVFTNFLTQCFS